MNPEHAPPPNRTAPAAMTRDSLKAAALVALSAAPLLLVRGAVPWARPLYSLQPPPSFMAAFFASYLFTAAPVLLVCHAVPRRLRGGALLIASLAFLGTCYSWPAAAALVLATLIFHVLVRRLPPKTLLPALLVWAGVFLFWMPPCFMRMTAVSDWHNRFIMHNLMMGMLFVTIFKRATWAWYDVSHHRIRQPWSVLHMGLFLLGFPGLLGLSACPSFADFVERCNTPDDSAQESGIRAFVGCVGTLYAAVAIEMFVGFERLIQYAVDHWQTVSVTAIWISILAFRWWTYAFRLYSEQMSVALWRLLGYSIRDEYASPLLASSVADFWRRWHMLWREFLMLAFYYPTALTLGRRYGAQPWGAAVAVLVTFTASALFDLFPWIAYQPATGTQMMAFIGANLLYHAAYGALVALELYADARAGHRVAERWPRWAAVPLTYVAVSVLNMFHGMWVTFNEDHIGMLRRALGLW